MKKAFIFFCFYWQKMAKKEEFLVANFDSFIREKASG